MLYTFKDDYIDSREKISSFNGNASTLFTYLGIPCLFLGPLGKAGTIIGGVVTLLGAGTTSISIGAGSYKNVFKDTLSSSIADCDYNIYLKTYDSAVSSSISILLVLQGGIIGLLVISAELEVALFLILLLDYKYMVLLILIK